MYILGNIDRYGIHLVFVVIVVIGGVGDYWWFYRIMKLHYIVLRFVDILNVFNRY